MNTKTNRRLAVFDLDNTLIDSQGKLIADFRGAMARLGKTITPEEAAAGKWYETAAAYGLSKEEFDVEFHKRKTWEESLRDGEVSIFPETLSCLEELLEGRVRLALLSKSIPSYTDLKLSHFNLRKYFEAVKTVHPKVPSKREGALELIKELAPERTDTAYFIGDREEDVSISRDVAQDYHLDTEGIYVNSEGLAIPGYTSVRNLCEVNDRILRNGR